MLGALYSDTGLLFEGDVAGYFLVKVNPVGDTIWTSLIDIQNLSGIYNIYEMPDSSILMLAGSNPYYTATCTGEIYETSTDQLTIIRISGNGALLTQYPVPVMCEQDVSCACMSSDQSGLSPSKLM